MKVVNVGRRIQTITVAHYGSDVKVNDGRPIESFNELDHFIGNDVVKFSRRKFSGAKKAVFMHDDVWWMNGGVYTSFPEDQRVDICATKARKYLGFAKNAKKFTVWYKRV